MGMGTGSGVDYNTVYYLSARSPKDKDGFFKVSKSIKDDWEDHEDQKWVGGKLVSIDILKKEYDGNPYNVLRMKFEDDPGILYIVDFRVDMYVGRELINRLLSVTSFGYDTKVVLYTSDAKDGYDRGFNKVSVQINGQKPGLPPKYITEEFKAMYETYKMKGGKEGKDFAEQEAFLLKELIENIIPLVGGASEQATAATNTKPDDDEPAMNAVPDPEPSIDIEEDSGLPF